MHHYTALSAYMMPAIPTAMTGDGQECLSPGKEVVINVEL